MLAQITSGAVYGVDACLVRVEVHLAGGLPAIHVVGLPENAVREGRQRVLAALASVRAKIPAGRITINLSPADMRKDGSAFDLPMALALLAAAGAVEAQSLRGMCVVGELGLDGTVRAVRGVLPIADRCRRDGVGRVLCPGDNAGEAAAVGQLEVLPVPTLAAALDHLRGTRRLEPAAPVVHVGNVHRDDADFCDVKGQETAKRILEIAAAGNHNVLLHGPPGAGKSMLARRVPGILPPLSREEAVEATRIYSVAGALRPGQALVGARPFRAPHHTISDAGLVGGGSPPRPGEVSLAHTGVLFLDELPEFRRNALEALRQPLEEHRVVIGRARGSLCYPARVMLIAAMNPCPCGYADSAPERCVCRRVQVERYAARISGPLLDRIDLHVQVPAVRVDRLGDERRGEGSAVIAARVAAARAVQHDRFAGHAGVFANADMTPRLLREHCALDAAGELILRRAVERMGLSARGFHRVLRVARTIADLAGEAAIAAPHVAEAVQCRAQGRGASIPAG